MNKIKFADFEGMNVLEIRTISPSEINIYLKASNLTELSIEDLLNIKVTTAGKTEQKISDIPASVVVVSREDIEAYGYQSLKEILSNMLGMYKLDDYRNVSFGVRGFFTNVYSRNIVFLINGVKQQQPFQGWNDLNLMNLQVESIERIEFVRGPVAIIYGNDAFFGAINIITHQNNHENNTSVTTAFGSENTYRSNLQYNASTNNSYVNFSAGFYKTDGRNVPFSKMLDSVQRTDQSWVKDASTNEIFKQHSRNFNINIGYKSFYTNISYDETQRNLSFRPVIGSIKTNRKDAILRTVLGVRYKINPKFSFDLHTSIENLSWTNNMQNLLPGLQYGFTKVEAKKLNTELITFIQPISKVSITMGANYNVMPNCYEQTDIPELSIERSSEILYSPIYSYAAFSQVEVALNEKLRLLAGVRATKQDHYDLKNERYVNNTYVDTIYTYSYNKLNIIPRIAIVNAINSKNVLKLMYSEAISRPGIYENSYILWNWHPMLVPQTISTFEFNYSAIPLPNLSLSTSFFYNNLNHLINRQNLSDPINHRIIDANNNSGKLETYGGEVQLIYSPIENLKFDVSLSYQETTNKLFNVDAANSPRILAYFKGIYTIKKDVVVGVNSYFVGKMETDWDENAIDPDNGNFAHKGRIHKTIPSYFNLGANLRFNNISKSGIYCSIHFENMLNSDIFYAPTMANRISYPNGTLESGIKINTSVGFKF